MLMGLIASKVKDREWQSKSSVDMFPFAVDVHCVAHQTNIVVQTLSNLPLDFCIENLL